MLGRAFYSWARGGQSTMIQNPAYRSGKSTIMKVIFQGISPKNLYIDSTTEPEMIKVDTLVGIEVYDVPGYTTVETLLVPIQEFDCLIFILDAQDNYYHALDKLQATCFAAHQANPDIKIEVLVHKVDGLSDEYKYDTLRDVQQRSYDDLVERNLDDTVQINFHTTSVFDLSCLEAMSRIVQRLLPQQAALESLLTILCNRSDIEKAYLCDTKCRIYLATDASPVDQTSDEACSDLLTTFIGFKQLYTRLDTRADTQERVKTEKYAAASIKLQTAITVAYWQVFDHFSLIALMRSENWDRFEHKIDQNVAILRTCLRNILEIESAD